MVGQYVIVRTYSAGGWAGTLESRKGKEVILIDARWIWLWVGAATIAELAQHGTALPDECRFPCPVDRVILTEVVSIFAVTAEAYKSIESVPIWTAHRPGMMSMDEPDCQSGAGETDEWDDGGGFEDGDGSGKGSASGETSRGRGDGHSVGPGDQDGSGLGHADRDDDGRGVATGSGGADATGRGQGDLWCAMNGKMKVEDRGAGGKGRTVRKIRNARGKSYA